ncbi:MAG TPA: BON domain-containing protein [Steroidobacteraceae bacterium]|jgi:hyperosmotically inducible protein|nr:BON domain-containing protein [Steroidobacteraceae bacterium]HTL92670.1 BON domain-containing protein [Steroidobacteraceae bacterium]
MHKYLVAVAALALTSAAAWADNGSNHPMKDSYITSKVKAELAADHDTKARDIHVTTVNGIVTLRGVASSSAEKDRAEQDAMHIKGVKSVNNEIKVPD